MKDLWIMMKKMLTSPVIGNVDRLASLGGMSLCFLTFSLIIIHNSFMIIYNHGSIHINVEVFFTVASYETFGLKIQHTGV
jgi:hypothetical protein